MPTPASFAGRDPGDIHHLERDAEFLTDVPKAVPVPRLRNSHGDVGGEL